LAKYKLDISVDYNFDLIGIAAHLSDYRLCWFLNEQLQLRLHKSEAPFYVSDKNGKISGSFSMFEWLDEDNFRNFFLLKNKSDGQFLFPELPKIDYFLVVQEAGSIDIDDFLMQMKEIKPILAVFNLDVATFSSSKKLIF